MGLCKVVGALDDVVDEDVIVREGVKCESAK